MHLVCYLCALLNEKIEKLIDTLLRRVRVFMDMALLGLIPPQTFVAWKVEGGHILCETHPQIISLVRIRMTHTHTVGRNMTCVATNTHNTDIVKAGQKSAPPTATTSSISLQGNI